MELKGGLLRLIDKIVIELVPTSPGACKRSQVVADFANVGIHTLGFVLVFCFYCGIVHLYLTGNDRRNACSFASCRH